jgi:hypothetical protein
VVEGEISMQYTLDPTVVEVDNVVATSPLIEAPRQFSFKPSPSDEKLANKFFLSIVEKEKKDNAGRVHWKKSIIPQWNSWWTERNMTNPMTYKQLKNRHQFLQKKLQAQILAQISTDTALIEEPPPSPIARSPPPIPTSLRPIQDFVASIPSSLSPTPLSSQPPNSTGNVNDQLQGIPSTCDIPSSSHVFISPKNMPSWELINSIEVPQAPARSPYSTRESALFMFLLNTPSERAKYCHGARSTIDWTRFSNRWKYWCQAETALGSRDLLLRTAKQLKQRKKDNVS